MRKLRRILSVFLAVCMIAGLTGAAPVASSAAEEPAVQAENSEDPDGLYRIVHLDAGRKYFSVDSIKGIIDTMSEAGFNSLELAVGNDGMRFLLDDMTLTVGDKTYESGAVKTAIQNGNKEYSDFGTNELTESEMDEIIRYASEKNISIIPLINTPGHMDAILDAMTELGVRDAAYGDDWRESGRTVDVTNEEAKAFTLAFVQKYIQYFAGKGCSVFNMGADEYANDVFTGGGMGFGQLQSQGQYGAFVDYVNEMARQVKAAGMRPMAFNDGIYYHEDTESGTFDDEILIAYWSSGWSGYEVASASFLSEKGFDLVNTNGDYYWIVGGSQCSAEKAAGFDMDSFMGENAPLEAAGAMFCIWCDHPQAMSEQNVVADAAGAIKAFGSAISDTQVPEPEPDPVPEPDKATVSDETTGISVKAAGLTAVEAEQLTGDRAPVIAGTEAVVAYDIRPQAGENSYTGEAEVSIPVPEGWDGSRVHAYVQEADGSFSQAAGTYADGRYTYTAPHFSVQALGLEAQNAANGTQRVEVSAGDTTTITIPGVDLTDEVDDSALDTDIAAVQVEKKKVEAQDNWQLVTNGAAGIVPGDQYLIVSGSSGSQYALTSEGGASQVSISGGTIENAPAGTAFTLVQNGNGYSLRDENGRYLYPDASRFLGWSYSLETNKNTAQPVTISGSSSVTISRDVESGWDSKTSYISYSAPGWFSGADYDASSDPSALYLFHKVVTSAGVETEITISGVSEGETFVTVGDTVYQIVVEDRAPSGALTDRSLQVEYWITNSGVHEEQSTNSPSSTTISRDEASDPEGVAIEEQVPETAYSNYDGWVKLHFWQAMRLDAQNHQSGDSGDDETADGTAFTRVRWHNNAWQYMTADGLWHYFMSGDQAVAYYMRHTTITREITTAMKDWGYATDGTTPDTSSGQGQVALTVAVVYPDYTVSPSEGNMYSRSTTIFNYWAGRDIGIIAPLNNSEYEVSRITVTDGTRHRNTNSNTWNSSDSIDWDKVRIESGEYWYDETEVWNNTMSSEPMVNGETSNIVFTGKNTAKLVLIYLEPVQNDNNLIVNWVDDSNDGALINTMQVVVRYEGSNEINFFNGLKQDSDVPQTGGSFTLDDDAYITNSSGVDQTFNKDITVMDVDPQYRSGLYQYSGADLSEDGKILTLHYTLNTEALQLRYVVDFGLPVEIPLSDLVNNVDDVTNVSFYSSKLSYNPDSKTITYRPTRILTGIDAVTVLVHYDSDIQRFSVGFVPATTVYYEEGFAEYSEGWTGASRGDDIQQKSAPGMEDANQYGYDGKYAAEEKGPSNGTAATSNAYGDSAELTFTGTGIDIYTNSTPDSGRLFVTVTDDAGSIVKVVQVDTALKAGGSGATAEQEVKGYNVPVVSLDLGEKDTYTVKLTHIRKSVEESGPDPVSIDGYRVYGTLDGGTEAYREDHESGPEFVELRDQVLAALKVDTSDSQYAEQIAGDMMSQVYDPDSKGAALVVRPAISGGNHEEMNAQDLLDNGPKNEVYLRQGESVVFTLGESVGLNNVQVGLKALDENVEYTIQAGGNPVSAELSSSTDMFYRLDGENSSGRTVTITNKGDGILSVTKIKFTGVGEGAEETSLFGTLTEEDLIPVLEGLGFERDPAAVTEDLIDAIGEVTLDSAEAVDAAAAAFEELSEEDQARVANRDVLAAAEEQLADYQAFAEVFTDVSPDDWFFYYIYDVYEKSLMTGPADAVFKPTDDLVRAEFAMVLYRADGAGEVEFESIFPDVEEDGWFALAVTWGVKTGVIHGYSNGFFGPADKIQRQQAALMMFRYAQALGYDTDERASLDRYTDCGEVDEFAREAVEWAAATGLMTGKNDQTELDPRGNISRAECATILARFTDLYQ